jgi:hypothetical protein
MFEVHDQVEEAIEEEEEAIEERTERSTISSALAIQFKMRSFYASFVHMRIQSANR